MPKPQQKYIVWSYDASEWQTFADIVLAKSPAGAASRVRKARPYATLDAYIPPMLLSKHIAALTRELNSEDDGFAMIEQEAR